MSNATANFLGPEATWAQARIDLHDVQGLWGGQAITVLGSGVATIERVGPAFPTERFTVTLTEAETRALFHQFIVHDFLTIHIPLRPGIPDEAHPQLTLTNAYGEPHTVSKWAGQKDDRFDTLYRLLTALAELRPNISAQP